MAYGKLKVDTITYDNSGSDVDVLVSALAGAGSTAGTGTTNTFTALQTMNAGLAVDGPYKQTAETVTNEDISLATGNYFTKTISADTTFTFSNPPTSGTVGSFTLALTHTSGTVTWPATVKWPQDFAPSLNTGKTHLFVFVTDDNGSRYRGASLIDYVN